MRTRLLVAVVAVAMASLMGCRREGAITGSYGDGVISGQVVMAGEGSPAGVVVSVVGTGMSTVVGDDGRFAFAGVPDGAELRFRRGSDVDAGFPLVRNSGSITVEVSGNSANPSRRRGVGKPGPRLSEFEGLITVVSATELKIFDSHGVEETFKLVAETIIRKGDATLTAADLQVDFRVHVRASVVDDVKTAVLVIVQQDDNDDDGEDDERGGVTVNANGTVTQTGAAQIVVRTVPRGEITVKVDANTIIKKRGDRIALADIKVGDEMNSHGTRVDDHTILAREIEVRGKSGR